MEVLIKELMSPCPHVIAPNATLRKAARKMQQYDCGAMLVVEGGALRGVMTDRDIVIWGLAEGADADETTVSEIMTVDVVTCHETDTLEHAADLMSETDVRRLAVLNVNDRLVGVVSIVDMIKSPDSDEVNDNVMHHLFRYA